MARRDQEQSWKGIQHCRIRSDVTYSIAWRILSVSAKALYLDLRAKLRMNNNGNVSAVMKDMKHVGWVSSATLSKSLYELLALGFIVKTRGGGVERGSKQCTLYAFTDIDVDPIPKLGIEKRRPSFDYRNFRTISEAQFALENGMGKLRAESLLRKGRVTQKKNDASKFEQVKPSIASDSEQVGVFAYSNFEQVERVANVA